MDNPVANLNEYELRHLAAHLEASGRVEDLHRLLHLRWVATVNALAHEKEWKARLRGTSASSYPPAHKNAWYEAHIQAGSVADFLNDVERAWRLAEKAGGSTHDASMRSKSFGLQCRYALIRASVNSLVSIPLSLLLRLVQTQIWTPNRGLEYALEIPDRELKAKSLVRLATYLPENDQPEVLRNALNVVRDIQDGARQASVLADLAPYLNEDLLREALAIADRLPQETGVVYHPKSEACTALIPRLAALGFTKEAFEKARMVHDSERQVLILAELAPHLEEDLLWEALALVEELSGKDHGEGTRASKSAARQKVEEISLRKLLAFVNQLFGQTYRPDPRSVALTALLLRLAALGRIQEALEGAQTIEHPGQRAVAFTRLFSLLQAEPLKGEAWYEAWQGVAAIDDGEELAQVLMSLISSLPDSLKGLAVRLVLARTRQALRRRSSRSAEFLNILAVHLVELGYLEETLGAVWMIRDTRLRARVLAAVMPHLPVHRQKKLLLKAIDQAQSLGDWEECVWMLISLASVLPTSLKQRVLSIIGGIRAADKKKAALAALVPYLPRQLLLKALDMIQSLEDGYDRAMTLAALAPYLSGELVNGIYTLICAIEEEDPYRFAKPQPLAALAPYLPDQLRERPNVQQAIRINKDYDLMKKGFRLLREQQKQLSLTRSAPPWQVSYWEEQGEVEYLLAYRVTHMTDRQLPIALDQVMAMKDSLLRSETLAEIVPRLAAQGYATQALMAVVVGTRRDTAHRGEALESLVPFLVSLPSDAIYPVYSKVLHELASSTRQDLLEAVETLAPVMMALGNVEAIEEIARAILDVGRWWP